MIRADTWLRTLGLFGDIVTISSNSGWRSRIRLGYQFPAWLLSKSISLDLQLGSLIGGLQILPSTIIVQNRVSIQTRFLQACLAGDAILVKQLLAEGQGHVGHRSTCSGQTPLLVGTEARI